jgi:RNA polymerase sigma-70 factor (ECF subfamily)
MGSGAAAVSRRRRACGEQLLHAFAEARTDLVQTLTQRLGSVEDAQDAAQETFLKCWRTRDNVPTVRNLRAWIFQVGLNAARDLMRNAWRRKVRPLTDPTSLGGRPGASAADHLLHQEALDRLRAALTGLRSEEREIFLLRQNSDLTYEDIATRRRVPVGTVKTQMRAALHKLRGVLHETDRG